MKKHNTVRLNEGLLRAIVRESLAELDWKTAMSAQAKSAFIVGDGREELAAVETLREFLEEIVDNTGWRSQPVSSGSYDYSDWKQSKNPNHYAVKLLACLDSIEKFVKLKVKQYGNLTGKADDYFEAQHDGKDYHQYMNQVEKGLDDGRELTPQEKEFYDVFG